MRKGLILLLVILLVVTNVNIGETSAIPLPSTWQDSEFQYQQLSSFITGGTPPVVTLTPGMRFGRSHGVATGINVGQIMTTPLNLNINVNEMGPFLPNSLSHFTGYIWFGNSLTQFNTSLILPTSTGSFNLTWASPISMPAGSTYELIWQVNELNHGNPSARVTWSSVPHTQTYSHILHHKSAGSATNLVAMPLNTNPIMPVNIGINDDIVIEYVGFNSIQVRQLGGAWLTNLPSVTFSPNPQRLTIPQAAFVWTNNQITLQTSTGAHGAHIRVIRGGSRLTTNFAPAFDGSTQERTMTVFGSHSDRANEQLQLRLSHPLSGGVRIMNITSVLTSTWSHTFTHLSHGFYNLEIGFDNGGIFHSHRQIAYYVDGPSGGSLQSGIITTPSPNEIIYDNKVRVTGAVANIPSGDSVRVILNDKGSAAYQIQILPHGATTFDLEFLNVAEGSYSILVESFQGMNFRLLTSHSIIVASSTLAPPTVDPNAGVLEQLRQSVEVILWWLMTPFRTMGDVGRVIISTIAESYQDGVGTFVAMMGIFYSVMPEPMANAITILVNVTVLVTVIKLVRG